MTLSASCQVQRVCSLLVPTGAGDLINALCDYGCD